MTTFFTKRQRALAGIPTEDEAPLLATRGPPRCCEQAVVERCTCEARRWRCPVHGLHGEACTGRTHD